MKGTIMNVSLANKALLIHSEYKDKIYELWYNVPYGLQDILTYELKKKNVIFKFEKTFAYVIDKGLLNNRILTEIKLID